ncbi:MAG: alpha/beta hydrolase [Desulforhopalus sp.]
MTSYSKIDQPEVIALLFPPQKSSATPCPADAEDVSFDISSTVALKCRYYSSSREGAVLFLYPATESSFQSFDLLAENYVNRGVNVFIASYRGCGMNQGMPSVEAAFEDSEKLFRLAVDWLRLKGCTGPCFVMGQSLGSIYAIDTVFKNGDSVKGLIIESGICGTADYLKASGASPEQAEILEADGFNTIEKIEKIKVPTLIFHGAKDPLVAVTEAEKLQASSGARTKQFFVMPGAERLTVSEKGGDLYLQTIKQFMDTVSGVNTWRQKRKSYRTNQKDPKV